MDEFSALFHMKPPVCKYDVSQGMTDLSFQFSGRCGCISRRMYSRCDSQVIFFRIWLGVINKCLT